MRKPRQRTILPLGRIEWRVGVVLHPSGYIEIADIYRTAGTNIYHVHDIHRGELIYTGTDEAEGVRLAVARYDAPMREEGI
jgi:hypothetical protein